MEHNREADKDNNKNKKNKQETDKNNQDSNNNRNNDQLNESKTKVNKSKQAIDDDEDDLLSPEASDNGNENDNNDDNDNTFNLTDEDLYGLLTLVNEMKKSLVFIDLSLCLTTKQKIKAITSEVNEIQEHIDLIYSLIASAINERRTKARRRAIVDVNVMLGNGVSDDNNNNNNNHKRRWNTHENENKNSCFNDGYSTPTIHDDVTGRPRARRQSLNQIQSASHGANGGGGKPHRGYVDARYYGAMSHNRGLSKYANKKKRKLSFGIGSQAAKRRKIQQNSLNRMKFDNLEDGYNKNSQIILKGGNLINDDFDRRSQSQSSCKSTITKSKYIETNVNGNRTSTFSRSKKKTNTNGNFLNKFAQQSQIDDITLNELKKLKNRSDNSIKYKSKLDSMSRQRKLNKNDDYNQFSLKNYEKNRFNDETMNESPFSLSNYDDYENNDNDNDRGRSRISASLKNSRNSRSDLNDLSDVRGGRNVEHFDNVNHKFNDSIGNDFNDDEESHLNTSDISGESDIDNNNDDLIETQKKIRRKRYAQNEIDKFRNELLDDDDDNNNVSLN